MTSHDIVPIVLGFYLSITAIVIVAIVFGKEDVAKMTAGMLGHITKIIAQLLKRE